MLRREVRCDDLGAAIEGDIDEVRAVLESQADEGLHHRHRGAGALLQCLVAPLGHADVLDHDLIARQDAFQALQRRVVRAGFLVDADRHAGEVARLLNVFVKGQDRLRAHRRP